MHRTRTLILAGLFAVFGLIIAACISDTLNKFPLFHWATDDLPWTRAWLFATVLDYYGLALPLSAIALLSEDVPYGFLWAAGFCLLGSPVACAYMVMRLLFKSVALAERDKEDRRSE